MKPVNSDWFVLLVCYIVVMVSAAILAEGNECDYSDNCCPKVTNSSGGVLVFVDSFPKQPMFEKSGQFFYLTCCTGDHPHAKTTWYKWSEHQWLIQNQSAMECEEAELSCHYYTTDNGQALKFESAGHVSNSGMYLCIATDGHTTINRTFDVRVALCTDNPTEIKFSQPSDTQASRGSTYTQDCRGDFGCKGAEANDSLAWWLVIDEKGFQWNLTTGKQGRYSVKETRSWDGTKKGAELTIEGVTEEDFHSTFVCQLKMRDLPTVGFSFTLAETGHRTALRRFIPLIVGMSVFAAVVIFIVLLTYLLCLPWALFCLTSAVGCLPKRDPDRHSFDVMLVSREEPEEGEEAAKVMTAMADTLREKGYSLYSCLTGGSARQFNEVEKCVSLIFIIDTFSLEAEPDYVSGFDFYFSNAAEARTNMVFVSTQRMSTEAWERLSEEYQRVYRHASKVCLAVTWPGMAPGFRSKANFWSQVQRFLPKPQPRSANQHNEASNGNAVDSSRTEQAPLTENQHSEVSNGDTADRYQTEQDSPSGELANHDEASDGVVLDPSQMECTPLTGNSSSYGQA